MFIDILHLQTPFLIWKTCCIIPITRHHNSFKNQVTCQFLPSLFSLPSSAFAICQMITHLLVPITVLKMTLFNWGCKRKCLFSQLFMPSCLIMRTCHLSVVILTPWSPMAVTLATWCTHYVMFRP